MSVETIIFIVLYSILTIYLLLFVMNITFIKVFLKKFREHKHALNIALTEKYEVISALIDLANKNNVSLDENILNVYKEIKTIDFVSFETEVCDKSKNSLALLKQEVISACKNSLANQIEYENYVEQLNMLDNQIRYLVVSYNADVIGYNYWIHFKPFRYVFYLMGVKEKNIK